MKLEHPLIEMLLWRCAFLSSNKKIVFCWVPSHVGIGGDEKAELAAKTALNLLHGNLGIPYTELKFHIDKNIMFNWQDE